MACACARPWAISAMHNRTERNLIGVLGRSETVGQSGRIAYQIGLADEWTIGRRRTQMADVDAAVEQPVAVEGPVPVDASVDRCEAAVGQIVARTGRADITTRDAILLAHDLAIGCGQAQRQREILMRRDARPSFLHAGAEGKAARIAVVSQPAAQPERVAERIVEKYACIGRALDALGAGQLPV